MPRRVLFLVCLALACAAGAEAAPPVTGEALLAAGVPWATVRQVAGPTWWPQVPQFESPPLFAEATPAKPVAVTSQWYAQVGTDVAIQTTLLAFRGAPRYCSQLVASSGVEQFDAHAPVVGTSHAYWTTSQENGSPATVLCFERGSVAVRIQVLGGKWGTARMALLARPVDAGVQALLAGRLAAAPIPAATLARLPAVADAPGRALGTAVLPNEAWAANAEQPPPKQLLGQLTRGGSKTVLFRRYVLADRTNVVDVTLFSLASAAAAGGWFDTLAASSSVASTELDPGATGKRSLLRTLDDYVVLDFAAGRFVADIACYAPHGERPSDACAAVARRLGERWYAGLARG